MSVISAVFLSLVAGLATAIPGLVSEFSPKAPSNIPLLIDVKSFWGKKLTRGEIFWLGFAIHLLMAALYGALYEFGVLRSSINPYSLDNLAVYSTLFWLLMGGVIFPVVGLGLFGRKEGKYVWLELLVTHHLLGFFVWALVALFPALRP